jgi:hypothetical protein
MNQKKNICLYKYLSMIIIIYKKLGKILSNRVIMNIIENYIPWSYLTLCMTIGQKLNVQQQNLFLQILHLRKCFHIISSPENEIDFLLFFRPTKYFFLPKYISSLTLEINTEYMKTQDLDEMECSLEFTKLFIIHLFFTFVTFLFH